MYDPDNNLHALINDDLIKCSKYTIDSVVGSVGKHVRDMYVYDIFLQKYMYRMHHHARNNVLAEIEFNKISGWIFDECVRRVDSEKLLFEEEGLVVGAKYLKCFIDRHEPLCDSDILFTRLKRYYDL